jgi:hypothetical protein
VQAVLGVLESVKNREDWGRKFDADGPSLDVRWIQKLTVTFRQRWNRDSFGVEYAELQSLRIALSAAEREVQFYYSSNSDRARLMDESDERPTNEPIGSGIDFRPMEGKQAAEQDNPTASCASGEKMPEAPISRPKTPRGKLDKFAAIELTKNPSLTNNQLAAMRGCNANTLRNRKKCPLLAAAKAMIRAGRDNFRDVASW